jgi:hypothetical protein
VGPVPEQVLAKDFNSGWGQHRYEVAQGFHPAFVRFRGVMAEAVLDQASDVMHAQPELVWRSHEAEGWEGPPAVWASWAA